MYYVELNGHIIPTPYETQSECFDACDELQARLCAPNIRCVFIS